MEYPKAIPAVLAERARANPEKIFIREVGGREVTYGAFQTEALKWAALFSKLGVKAGDTVLTMLPPTVDAYAVWIGLAWLRAIEVPCNLDFQGRMLGYVLQNSGARVAVIAGQFTERFRQIADQAAGLEIMIVPDEHDLPELPWKMLARRAVDAIAPAEGLVPPDVWDTSLIIYTSGTTGPSKGVMMSWGQQYENANGSVPLAGLTENDVYYSPFPLFHGGGRMPLCLMALANGHFVVRKKFNTEAFWDDIRTYGCTVTALVGAMVHFLWLQKPQPDDRDNPLKRAVMLPLHPEWRAFEQRFGIEVRTAYAMTECSPPFGTDWNISKFGTCGRLRPEYEIRIVDAHDFEVPEGEVGELIVRHARPWTLFQGYFRMPDKTAEAWRNGWLHTGDAFKRDAEGNYYFVDRFKDAIRRRGENISSFEVESLVNAHPEIAESAAVAVPSEWGEDEVKVVVVRKSSSNLSAETLSKFLSETMPRFMVPRYIEFVDSLPKTDATMRVKKAELRSNSLNANTWDREARGKVLPR